MIYDLEVCTGFMIVPIGIDDECHDEIENHKICRVEIDLTDGSIKDFDPDEYVQNMSKKEKFIFLDGIIGVLDMCVNSERLYKGYVKSKKSKA